MKGVRRGEALPRAPIKRRSPLRHVAIRNACSSLTGTVVPGKACREASCRKSPRMPKRRALPRESSSEVGTLLVLRASRCRDLLAGGSYPRFTLPRTLPRNFLFLLVGANTHVVMQGSRESSQDLILRSYPGSRPRDNTAECASFSPAVYPASTATSFDNELEQEITVFFFLFFFSKSQAQSTSQSVARNKCG